MKVTSIKEYIIDRINKKCADLVFQQLNTEYEMAGVTGADVGGNKYDWMIQRAMQILDEQSGVAHAEETKNQVEAGAREA